MELCPYKQRFQGLYKDTGGQKGKRAYCRNQEINRFIAKAGYKAYYSYGGETDG